MTERELFRCPKCDRTDFWRMTPDYGAAECDNCGHRVRADRLGALDRIRETIDRTPS